MPAHRDSGSRPAILEQVPFIIVMTLVAVAALRVGMYHWRQGAAIVGGALLVAALFRAVLPGVRAGLLAIRGRPVDVLSYAGLGVLLLFLAFTIADSPFVGT